MSIQKNGKIFLPVTKVYYADLSKNDSDIESIDENIDGSLTVNFNVDRDWKEFYQTTGKAKYNENERKQDEGGRFSQQLIINYPGNELENQQTINDLKNRPLILKMDMPDSNSKIIGTIENPAFFSSKFKSADYVATQTITFARLAEIPAPYLT